MRHTIIYVVHIRFYKTYVYDLCACVSLCVYAFCCCFIDALIFRTFRTSTFGCMYRFKNSTKYEAFARATTLTRWCVALGTRCVQISLTHLLELLNSSGRRCCQVHTIPDCVAILMFSPACSLLLRTNEPLSRRSRLINVQSTRQNGKRKMKKKKKKEKRRSNARPT